MPEEYTRQCALRHHYTVFSISVPCHQRNASCLLYDFLKFLLHSKHDFWSFPCVQIYLYLNFLVLNVNTKVLMQFTIILVAFYYFIFSSPSLLKPILSHKFSCSIFEINNLSFFGELENDEMLSGEDYCFVLQLQVLVDLLIYRRI